MCECIYICLNVAQVRGIFVLARRLVAEDTFVPRYVLDKSGRPASFIHLSPPDLMDLLVVHGRS